MRTTTIFRIQKIKHNSTTLTGEGAAKNGNRWNCKSIPLIYASASVALAAWELRVHLGGLPLTAYPPLNVAVLELPDGLIHEFSEVDLPPGWNKVDSVEICQAFLASYLASKHQLAYSLPSVVIPGERNILIDPKHPNIDQVKILRFVPFRYDSRL